MSHGIESMAYVGEHPWHIGMTADRSRQLLDSADLGTAAFMEAAQMGWQVDKVELFYRDPNTGEMRAADPGTDEFGEPLKGAAFASVRRDTGAFLGSVGAQHQAFQNTELFDLGDSLCQSGKARWHTAGSLFGGRKVWALLQAEGQVEVRSGDPLQSFILIYNAHDGSSKLRVRCTDTRVVCWNTASMALRGAATEFSARHTSSIGGAAAEAERVLGVRGRAFEESVEFAQKLAGFQLGEEGAKGFFTRLLLGAESIDAGKEESTALKLTGGRAWSSFELKRDELLRLWEHGIGNTGESAWDAVNAATEYVDWQRTTAANRGAAQPTLSSGGLAAAQFGTGHAFKAQAVAQARELIAA